jgi:hypothetical protein
VELRVVNVTLVMTDGPFCGFLGPDGIGPPESHDARTDDDAKVRIQVRSRDARAHKPTVLPVRTVPQPR